jgi:hypothetical protein
VRSVLKGKNAKNKQKLLAAALTAAVLGSMSPAAADTLKYDGAWFAPYSGNFTITDASPYRAPVTVKAGAFEMVDTSGPTLPAGSSFMAWCVDIYHFVSASTGYTLVDGADFYSGASYKATDLERLASYVFDSSLLTNSAQSAAFQLAAWEIVNDSAGTGSYDVNDGDFMVTSGDSAIRAVANSWLEVVDGGSYQISQTLSVWRQDVAGSTQDLAVFAPIPEPETYMMLLAGLGLMGFVARRRIGRGPA